MVNLEAEAVVMAEVITVDAVMVGPIIEVTLTVNTISIMVMTDRSIWPAICIMQWL